MDKQTLYCHSCGCLSVITNTLRDSKGSVRRERSCPACKKRWETLEIMVEDTEDMYWANDESHRYFSRDQRQKRRKEQSGQKDL